jgi:hypothetical protein
MTRAAGPDPRSTLPGGGRRSRNLWLLLAALGLVGLATMLLAPIEQLLPPGIAIPRAALLVQPAVLVVAFAALGWWAAPRAGLDAPVLGGLVERRDWASPLRRAMWPALAGGVVCGVCIAGFGAVAGDLLHGRAQSIDMPLVTRTVYGGTVEELIFRWGLLPLFTLALARLRLAPGAALWTANVATALLFAAGHVPGIMMAASDSPGWLPGAVMLANTIVGLVCGWLFIRRGFEAAMIAHALAHPVSVLLLALAA